MRIETPRYVALRRGELIFVEWSCRSVYASRTHRGGVRLAWWDAARWTR